MPAAVITRKATRQLNLPNINFRSPITRRTLVYYLAFIALGMSSSALGPTLPGLAAQTAVGLSTISIIFSTRSIGRLIGTYLAGNAFDRLPGHPMVAMAIFIMGAMTILTSFVPNLMFLVIVFTALGFGEGFMDVGMNTMLIWTHDENAGPFINGMHFCFGLGAFLFPVLLTPILFYTGTPDTTFIDPFLSAGIIPPPTQVNWAYRLLGLAFIPVPLLLLQMRSPVNNHVETSTPDAPRKAINWRLVLPFSLFLMLYVGAESGFSGWVYTYAIKRGLAGESSAAYLVSAYWLAITLGRLLAIPLAARFVPRTIIRAAVVSCIFFVSMINVIPTGLALWVGTVGLGLSMSSVFPTTLAFAGRNMALNGRITSYFYIGAGIGVSTVPWFIGQMFELISPATMPLIVLGILVAQLGVFFLLMHLVEGHQPAKN